MYRKAFFSGEAQSDHGVVKISPPCYYTIYYCGSDSSRCVLSSYLPIFAPRYLRRDLLHSRAHDLVAFDLLRILQPGFAHFSGVPLFSGTPPHKPRQADGLLSEVCAFVSVRGTRKKGGGLLGKRVEFCGLQGLYEEA